MGSFAASVAKDYLIVDDLQTVHYTTADGRTATLTGCDAHEYQATERAVLQGFFQAGDRVWYLPGDQLAAAGISPGNGDSLVDAESVAWSITGDCTLDEAKIAWECPSTKQR
jgi:hypothetical protein